MTYGNFKNLVTGLLIGDNALPKDDNVVKPLLSYAFNRVANEAEALHLLTLNKNKDILRGATGDYLLRTPNMPEEDSDNLDIDEDLIFPTAEFLAGFISKDNQDDHDNKASKLINLYNAKVESVLSSIRKNDDGSLYNE